MTPLQQLLVPESSTDSFLLSTITTARLLARRTFPASFTSRSRPARFALRSPDAAL
jgi:hypothetical protein